MSYLIYKFNQFQRKHKRFSIFSLDVVHTCIITLHVTAKVQSVFLKRSAKSLIRSSFRGSCTYARAKLRRNTLKAAVNIKSKFQIKARNSIWMKFWTFSCCVFYQNLCYEDYQGANHKKADKSILYSYPLDYERKNMAVVAGQQIISIPPWRLILLLVFLEIRVCSTSVVYFYFGLLILITVRYHHMSLFKHLLGQ